MTAVDEFDAWGNDRDEAHTATQAAPQTPRKGTLADALERGYDPQDAAEGTYQ